MGLEPCAELSADASCEGCLAESDYASGAPGLGTLVPGPAQLCNFCGLCELFSKPLGAFDLMLASPLWPNPFCDQDWPLRCQYKSEGKSRSMFAVL